MRILGIKHRDGHLGSPKVLDPGRFSMRWFLHLEWEIQILRQTQEGQGEILLQIQVKLF